MAQLDQVRSGGITPSGMSIEPLVAPSITEGLNPTERGAVLAQIERTMGPEAATRLAGGATVPPSGQISEIATADDPVAAAAFAKANPGQVEALKDALVAAGAHDAYHAVNTGVTDRAVIDRAQARTAGGGCAALGEATMLCNPAGPEIGEYTLPRQEGFPDYIGPDAPHSHLYRAQTSTVGSFPSLAKAAANRLADYPTPGDGWSANLLSLPREQNRATPEGTVNDAGLPDALVRRLPGAAEGDDQVRSYTATDVIGNAVVTNVTILGQHSLHPGTVAQGVRQDERGTTITVVGEGNGQLSTYVNDGAEHTFQKKIEGDIRAAIFNDSQR